MSAPESSGNPWLSLGDLLQIKTSVATLATSIEQYGIQTYDRFGRRIAATEDGPEEKVSKARALNLLASYYADITKDPHEQTSDPDWWFEWFSPLYDFGWPSDEAPDFNKFAEESVPNSVKSRKHDMDSPVETRTRRTYLIIMASLCKKCGINYEERGASQRIKEATEVFGAPVDDGTIQKILKEIPDARESRS